MATPGNQESKRQIYERRWIEVKSFRSDLERTLETGEGEATLPNSDLESAQSILNRCSDNYDSFRRHFEVSVEYQVLLRKAAYSEHQHRHLSETNADYASRVLRRSLAMIDCLAEIVWCLHKFLPGKLAVLAAQHEEESIVSTDAVSIDFSQVRFQATEISQSARSKNTPYIETANNDVFGWTDDFNHVALEWQSPMDDNSGGSTTNTPTKANDKHHLNSFANYTIFYEDLRTQTIVGYESVKNDRLAVAYINGSSIDSQYPKKSDWYSQYCADADYPQVNNSEEDHFNSFIEEAIAPYQFIFRPDFVLNRRHAESQSQKHLTGSISICFSVPIERLANLTEDGAPTKAIFGYISLNLRNGNVKPPLKELTSSIWRSIRNLQEPMLRLISEEARAAERKLTELSKIQESKLIAIEPSVEGLSKMIRDGQFHAHLININLNPKIHILMGGANDLEPFFRTGNTLFFSNIHGLYTEPSDIESILHSQIKVQHSWEGVHGRDAEAILAEIIARLGGVTREAREKVTKNPSVSPFWRLENTWAALAQNPAVHHLLARVLNPKLGGKVGAKIDKPDSLLSNGLTTYGDLLEQINENLHRVSRSSASTFSVGQCFVHASKTILSPDRGLQSTAINLDGCPWIYPYALLGFISEVCDLGERGFHRLDCQYEEGSDTFALTLRLGKHSAYELANDDPTDLIKALSDELIPEIDTLKMRKEIDNAAFIRKPGRKTYSGGDTTTPWLELIRKLKVPSLKSIALPDADLGDVFSIEVDRIDPSVKNQRERIKISLRYIAEKAENQTVRSISASRRLIPTLEILS